MAEFSKGNQQDSQEPEEFTDFSGMWLCVKQENMDKFLNKLGVGFVMKQMAWTFNYGVGKLKQEIEQEGRENMKLIVHSPKGDPKEQTIPLNGSKFSLTTEKGDVEASATWSSDGKTIDSTIGESMTGKRFMSEDGKMVVVQTKDGISATRYFEKQ